MRGLASLRRLFLVLVGMSVFFFGAWVVLPQANGVLIACILSLIAALSCIAVSRTRRWLDREFR